MTAMKFGRVELPGGAILHDASLSRDPSALFDRDALLGCAPRSLTRGAVAAR